MVRSRCCACVLGTCRVSYCACSRLTDVAAPSPDARRDLSHNVGTLLDELEIPRAISAPPQLDDRWALGLVRRSGELCGVAAPERLPVLKRADRSAGLDTAQRPTSPHVDCDANIGTYSCACTLAISQFSQNIPAPTPTGRTWAAHFGHPAGRGL